MEVEVKAMLAIMLHRNKAMKVHENKAIMKGGVREIATLHARKHQPPTMLSTSTSMILTLTREL